MTLPLYMKDFFGFPTGLVVAVVLGFLFGFVLERAGFGRAPVLAAQFYFRDTRVLKVMFSAIVTAMLGMVVLSGVGVLDLSAMRIPETFLWAQLAGGFLLGVGFIISGYCPGTSVVSAASGNLDGIVTVLGVILGSTVFGFFPAAVRDFAEAGAMGVVRLPDVLGVPQAVLALGVALMAVGAFVGGEMMERRVARGRDAEPPPSPSYTRRAVFAGFVMVAGLGLITLALPVAARPAAPRTAGTMTALELATTLVEAPASVYVVDGRDPDAYRRGHVPGALPPSTDVASLSPARTLVLYGTSTVPGFAGPVVMLEGGLEAFQRDVLSAPPRSASDYRLRAALRAHFTGAASAPPPVPLAQPAPGRGGRKKGGGC